MGKLLAKYNLGGISFFIPFIDSDDFTKDIMPVNQQESEDENTIDEEAAAAWFEREAEWQRMHDESNFPLSDYK